MDKIIYILTSGAFWWLVAFIQLMSVGIYLMVAPFFSGGDSDKKNSKLG